MLPPVDICLESRLRLSLFPGLVSDLLDEELLVRVAGSARRYFHCDALRNLVHFIAVIVVVTRLRSDCKVCRGVSLIA